MALRTFVLIKPSNFISHHPEGCQGPALNQFGSAISFFRVQLSWSCDHLAAGLGSDQSTPSR